MAHAGPQMGRLNRVSAAIVAHSVAPGFVGLMGIVVLSRAAGGPGVFVSWRITATFLVFAGLLMAAHHLHQSTARAVPSPERFCLQLALLAVLLGLLYQSRTPGIGPGVHRDAELAGIFLAVVGFCVLAADPREYSPAQWLAIGCFATVTGILFYHSADVAELSFRSRHPLWWSLLVGINLLVLPRYLSREQFLWSLNRLAAVLVGLALPIYVVGEYSLLGVQFTFHSTYTIPLLGWDVRATRSLFVNRNTLAPVLFAGIVGGVAEVHRRLDRERPLASAGLPGALLAINVLGFALAYDRKLWLISPTMLAVYAAYVAYGRRAIPVAMAAGVAYVAGGLLAIYYGVVPLDDSNRFALWGAGVRAILHRPLWLGEGLIAPGAWLDPFHELRAYSPHNSYVSIWLRTGIVGGVAYVLLVAGSVLKGTLEYRTVDVALLVLAFGFAVHQLFEAYTLYQTGTSSILATLAIGYLVFGLPKAESGPVDDEADDRGGATSLASI